MSLSRKPRGFTLVELMTVVAVVGILAVIAYVSYRKYRNSTHTAEATGIVGAIRAAQERYHAETGSYYDLSSALVANQTTSYAGLYPQQTKLPGNYKTAWGATCTSACKSGKAWTTLAVEVDSPVYYGYSTVASSSSTATIPTVTMGGAAIAWPPSTDWYVVAALGDADGNGTFSTVVGSSFDNDLRVDMDGE